MEGLDEVLQAMFGLGEPTPGMLCADAQHRLPYHEVPWQDLLKMAKRVVNDPEVKRIYPQISARPLKFRKVTEPFLPFTGRYSPQQHAIELCRQGWDYLTLLHEMAHAAEGMNEEDHPESWREIFVYLVYRFLGEETGRALQASFENAGLLKVAA